MDILLLKLVILLLLFFPLMAGGVASIGRECLLGEIGISKRKLFLNVMNNHFKGLHLDDNNINRKMKNEDIFL